MLTLFARSIGVPIQVWYRSNTHALGLYKYLGIIALDPCENFIPRDMCYSQGKLRSLRSRLTTKSSGIPHWFSPRIWKSAFGNCKSSRIGASENPHCRSDPPPQGLEFLSFADLCSETNFSQLHAPTNPQRGILKFAIVRNSQICGF